MMASFPSPRAHTPLKSPLLFFLPFPPPPLSPLCLPCGPSGGASVDFHVRRGLRMVSFSPGYLPPPHPRLPLGPFPETPFAFPHFIPRHETQVVRRPLILRIGIPKSDNEPHRPF